MSLRDRLQESAEQNPLLALALGLESAIHAVDRLLTEDSTTHGALVGAGGAGGAAQAALAPDDPFVLAALGVVALRRSIGAWLDSAAGSGGPSPLPADARPTTPNLEGIAR
jgi:phage tail tape-measure protein